MGDFVFAWRDPNLSSCLIKPLCSHGTQLALRFSLPPPSLSSFLPSFLSFFFYFQGIEATKKASSAREKWRKADIAAQKAKEKYEGLCGKIEELTDSAEGRKNAETYKKELEDAAEKEEWIDPVKVETCAKYRVSGRITPEAPTR